LNILVALNHQVRYPYEHPVTVFAREITLRPAPHCHTPVHAYAFSVNPE
jgi:hypothetical protein